MTDAPHESNARSDIFSPPRTPGELAAWLTCHLGIEVPGTAVIEGNATPLHYLAHAFFEAGAGPRDCVLWANRGGGKTFYGALATLLDLCFKPGISIKIVAGSLDQAGRMHDHLTGFLLAPAIQRAWRPDINARHVRLMNRAGVEILAQSQTSVRGTRPQKLRCDEVELFDPDVWAAAQMTTRARRCGPFFVRGTIEAFSTWHRPGGLMSRLLEDTRAPHASRRVFRWGVIDALEACPLARDCATCELHEECQGRAQDPARAPGHVRIDDAIAQKGRTDRTTWRSEMLCFQPSRRNAVFPEFDLDVHVTAFDPPAAAVTWIAGMDFGLRAPTVFLWACIDSQGVVRVVDEHVGRDAAVEHHVDAVSRAPWPRPTWIGADPAGNQDCFVAGISPVRVWRNRGYRVLTSSSRIEHGLRRIRALLQPAVGPTRLLIHPRCRQLILSLQSYHYDDTRPWSPHPVKDGADHAVDALRYLVIHLPDPTHQTTLRTHW
ncbi:MAG: hypothetical protein KDA21_04790 [Phycisphaerales bacterium]|nr:hypothetical protein [Phycisphaerales bacterium]